MNAANSAINSQLDAVFLVHQTILEIAAAGDLNTPLIFAGMAVVLCCKPHNFRPGCEKLSGDIDYIIPAADLCGWQKVLGIRFANEKNSEFTGRVGKTGMGEIEIDLLADLRMQRPIEGGTISCELTYENLSHFYSRRQAPGFAHIDPAQLLFFKLFLGRGKIESKYDFEDACALILDAEIGVNHFFETVFVQNHFSFPRAKFISNQLAKCVAIDEKAAIFKDAFDALCRVDEIIPKG